MVTTKLNLSMTEPSVRQIYAKQGDTGRVLDISLDQTPEDGTLRILRPDGVEVTSEAVTGGEVESGGSFESLTEADVTELTVGIEPVQDLNGYDKPWVGGAGKNLLRNNASSKTENGITFTVNADGTVSANGTASGTANIVLTSGRGIFDFDNDTILSGSVGGFGNNVKIRLGLGKPVASYDDFGNGVTIPRIADISTRYAYVQITIASGTTVNNVTFRPMIRLATQTDSTFAPYSNICPITGHDEVRVYFGAEQGTADETYTTSLGQTVYGGTLDMVSGVLTADRAMVSLLGSDLNIGSSQTKELNMWRLSLNNPYGTLASPYPSGISNKYVIRNSYNGVNNNNGSLGLNQTSGSQILIRDDSLTTAQEVIDAFNSTPLTFVYPLASPQTYTLTAQQIKTLVGTNNVWASSGDIVSIKFAYGGLFSELPSEATEIVGKCYCDVEQNGVSSMPFTLNVKKNERES